MNVNRPYRRLDAVDLGAMRYEVEKLRKKWNNACEAERAAYVAYQEALTEYFDARDAAAHLDGAES